MSRRSEIKTFLVFVHQNVFVGIREISRRQQLEAFGFKERDALHLACAESGEVDTFLTTDDRLLRRAKNYQTQLSVQVESPDIWVKQETLNEYFRLDFSNTSTILNRSISQINPCQIISVSRVT